MYAYLLKSRTRIFLFLLCTSTIIFLWKGYRYFIIENKVTELREFANLSETLIKSRTKVSIYYEALCSDSRNFILKQLVPTYELLQEYIDLDFIPYGKAQTIEKKGVITFKCQHANLECVANKVHACSLLHIKNQHLQLQYISCMIKDNMIPFEIGEKCAKNLGIVYDPILDCAKSDQSSLLLKEYGIRTQEVQPKITFIPTIQLNNKQTVPLVRILKNFKKELCKILGFNVKQCL
ncbi:hypothetical protein FQA39_LY00219 [Lamprigera yunnana]|nr:hypothetical protein FQA39_LY00219 [Lamprigera yunnana]